MVAVGMYNSVCPIIGRTIYIPTCGSATMAGIINATRRIDRIDTTFEPLESAPVRCRFFHAPVG